MNEQDELARRIREEADRLPIADRSPAAAMARGRRRRRITRAGSVVAALVLVVGVALPLRALMRFGEDPHEPASSDTPYLAFTNAEGEASSIWLVHTDGSGLHEVQTDLRNVMDPAWAPDGTQLVFTGGTEENTEPTDLYLVRPDGSDLRRITDTPAHVMDSDPAWSPDGRTIAFSRLEDGHSAIYTIEPDTGILARLTDEAFNQTTGPVWSPDGTQLAFTGNTAPRGEVGIFVMNADGSDVHPITALNDGGGTDSPAWSPDGTQIAFNHDFDIHVMDADGTNEQTIVSSSSNFLPESPEWSADGNQIAFMGSSCSDGSLSDCGGRGSVDIYITDADGSSLKQVTSNSGPDTGRSTSGIEGPSWQPATTTASEAGHQEAVAVESYGMTDFQITYPSGGGGSAAQEASVTYVSTWPEEGFPGRAECLVTLTSRDEGTVGALSFALTNATDGARSVPIIIPVSGEPVSADGSCADVAEPSTGGYVFDGPTAIRPVMNSATGEVILDPKTGTANRTDLTFAVSWVGEGDPEFRTCYLSVLRTDGRKDAPHKFNVRVGEGPLTVDIGGAPETIAKARMTCGPFEG